MAFRRVVAYPAFYPPPSLDAGQKSALREWLLSTARAWETQGAMEPEARLRIVRADQAAVLRIVAGELALMDDEDEIRTPGRKMSERPIHPEREPVLVRRPASWGVSEVFSAPAPVMGAFPKGFTEWALKQLRCPPQQVLHVCSGMLDATTPGVRLDIRPDARPTLCADGRALPFRDATFAGILLDPPYSVEYAEDLYGTEYPRPAHLLAEASRVVRPGGRIGILHFLVPQPPPAARFLSVHGVSTGLGYRIRAFTIYQRDQARLF